MARYPGFCGPAYTLSNPIAANDESINLYPSKVESGTGENDWTLEPSPGYEEFVELPEPPTRGGFSLNGGNFAVGGTKLYELTVNGTAIERASGLSNINNQLVSFASNGDSGFQMMI